MSVRRPALVLALLCALAASAGCGATLYVSRVVAAHPGALRLGDLVQVTGALSAEAAATLDRVVATMAGTLLSVPSRLYAGVVEEAFGPDSILVGSRTLVVPPGRLSQPTAQLYARLAEVLGQQDLLGDTRAEMEIVRPLGGDLPPGAEPRFAVARGVKTPAGQELICTVSAADSDRVFGTITLRVRTTAATAAEGVKAGDQVQILFHKGPVTIEMQGKALASAGFGDGVAVYVPDSRKSFSGRVIGKKAVAVELP